MPNHPAIHPASPAAIEKAAHLLQAGELVALPTETVYGLAGDATNPAAVARIYAAKGRPAFNPLICHVADLGAAERVGQFDARARTLARAFWPGPLTLIVPLAPNAGIAAGVTAGLPSVAIRIPDHPVALALLRAFGRPLAAPSANPSGRISPTSAAHVVDGLGDQVAMVLDGGPCTIGLESTIVALTGQTARLLRPGGLHREAIEALIGPVESAGSGPVEAPGMLASHYAPLLPVRLDAVAAQGNEALLAFGNTVASGYRHVLNLSPRGDLDEAAANLYAHLRLLDQAPVSGIAVMPIPDTGLGQAINDRLRRAAAPRTKG